MTPQQVMHALSSVRFSLTNEKRTQREIENALEGAGIPMDREVHLGDGDIVDFFLNGIAVEVKLSGARMQIYRQLERYCKHDSVESIILVSNVAMGLPKKIAGKPSYMVNLARAWL